MKRGKGLTINISNKVAYTLMAVVILAVIGGVVFAYNSNPADPAVFGHSADEIEGGFGGGSGILALGNWESKSTNTVYHADTDGYVSCYGYASDWEIYSDNNNPPTTLRARTLSGSGAYNYGTASMVKKGDYWKATQNGQIGGDSTAPVCYWIPFVNSGVGFDFETQKGYVGDGTTNSVPYTGTVDFPIPFSNVPLIFLTPHEPDGNGATSCRASTITTSGFTYVCFSGDNGYSTDGLMWLAMEK
jgi:hypothetical protein